MWTGALLNSLLSPQCRAQRALSESPLDTKGRFHCLYPRSILLGMELVRQVAWSRQTSSQERPTFFLVPLCVTVKDSVFCRVQTE